MVQVIKNVGRNGDFVKKNTNFIKNEVFEFEEDEFFFEDSGGHVSDNLVGLSSTLNYNIDEDLTGGNVQSAQFLSCLTSDILDKE